MPTNLISFPFRLGQQGSVVTRSDDSSDYYAEELGVLALVRPGERSQAPDFGIEDPVFGTIDPQEFALKVSIFGPPVNILSVDAYPLSENRQDITIKFEPADVETEETRIPVNEVNEDGTDA